jgi:TRAP-type C4-dicarboxylate transport system permease small subunit
MTQGTTGAERAASHAPPADEYDELAGTLPINPTIAWITRLLAIGGGVLMLAAVAITLVSVIGRYGFSAPLPGDYEMVELVCAVGIFLFFPYTHATGSNIVVRFFTVRLSERNRRALDLAQEFVFTAVAALLAWRLGIGFVEKFQSGESTMLIRVPYWWSYSFAVASLILLCVVCTARLIASVRLLRQ